MDGYVVVEALRELEGLRSRETWRLVERHCVKGFGGKGFITQGRNRGTVRLTKAGAQTGLRSLKLKVFRGDIQLVSAEAGLKRELRRLQQKYGLGLEVGG